jgi:hypothetical protein
MMKQNIMVERAWWNKVAHLMIARKLSMQRGRGGQDTKFKGMPPVTYFL